MKTVDKYDNLQSLLPDLSCVLADAIQNDFLDIKELNQVCNKYTKACTYHHELKDAKYVIYSPYINREDHNYESFIFVDATGKMVTHLSGREMELYNMIRPIHELHENEEYLFECKSKQKIAKAV